MNKSRLFKFFFVLIFLNSGCRVKFSDNEYQGWLKYNPGDILIYENQHGHTDTITIIEKEIHPALSVLDQRF